MSRIDRPGTFRATITQSGLGQTKSELPQFVAQFRATEYYDNSEVGNEQWIDWSQFEESEITGYFCLGSKKGEVIQFQAEALMKALGWSGETFGELASTDYTGTIVQIRVANETYDGKTSLKVVGIDHCDADPNTTLRTLDTDEVKKIDNKWGKALKKFSGGPKPKKVEGKPSNPDKKSESTESESTTKKDSTATKTKESTQSKKPGKPPRRSSKKRDKTATIADLLDLPEKATEDEAWDQVEEHKSEEFTDEQVQEKWLEVIEAKGGAEAIDEADDWAGVRDGVLSVVSDKAAELL